MTFTILTNGTLPNADEVKENFEVANRRNLVATNISSHPFTTDEAATKTNLTYDPDDDSYKSTSGAIVLETATVGTDIKAVPEVVSDANVNWDFYVATVHDETNDSSIDTNEWLAVSETTFTENTVRLNVHRNAGGSTTQVLSTNSAVGKDFTGDFTYAVLCRFDGFNGGVHDFRFGDGTNFVTIDSPGTTGRALASFRVVVDDTNDELWAWVDGVFLVGPLDISGINATGRDFFWRGQVNGSTDSDIDIYHSRVIDGTETTVITQSFSSDGGSNFDTVTRSAVNITLANRRYTMRTKLTGTIVAGEVLVAESVDYQGLTVEDF